VLVSGPVPAMHSLLKLRRAVDTISPQGLRDLVGWPSRGLLPRAADGGTPSGLAPSLFHVGHRHASLRKAGTWPLRITVLSSTTPGRVPFVGPRNAGVLGAGSPSAQGSQISQSPTDQSLPQDCPAGRRDVRPFDETYQPGSLCRPGRIRVIGEGKEQQVGYLTRGSYPIG